MSGGRSRRNRLFGVVAILSATVGATAAAAQDGDLRARQEALYERLFAEPDNLELMFDHALVSVELRDYEAAITTLERMLIFNPSLSRAKVELGAAYFRLGAYENARYYFEDVLENDAPPPEVERRIGAFLDEIGKRTQTSGFTGVASVGVAYSTNANLGPPDANVLVLGAPAVLNQEFVETDDLGFRAVAQGRHYYDLNRPNNDVWLTDLSLFTLNYLDESRGDIDSVSLLSGPRLSLDERAYGPKIRPFFSAELLTSGNELLYYGAGLGADYTDTVSDEINVFAGFESKWREYDQRNEFDGHSHRAAFGGGWSPDANSSFTALVFAETDQARSDFNTNYELGLRLGATRRYDSGLDLTDRLWSVTGFATVTGRWFEEPNVAISGRTRSDVDLRAGVSHLFHLSQGFFIQAEADYLYRDSNIPNFDIENFGATVSVGLTF